MIKFLAVRLFIAYIIAQAVAHVILNEVKS